MVWIKAWVVGTAGLYPGRACSVMTPMKVKTPAVHVHLACQEVKVMA